MTAAYCERKIKFGRGPNEPREESDPDRNCLLQADADPLDERPSEPPSTLAAELERVGSVRHYRSLPLQADPGLDAVMRAAMRIHDMPTAWITLIDDTRQFIVVARGEKTEVQETDRRDSICSITIRNPDHPLIVGDTTVDPRFADSKLVSGDTAIHSYAGVALVGREGLPLGALCLLDHQARSIEPSAGESLKSLARAVEAILERQRLSQERRQEFAQVPETKPRAKRIPFVAGPDGILIEVDAACLAEDSASEFRAGRNWLSIVHPMERDRASRQWRDAVDAGAVFEAEFPFCIRPTDDVWVRASARPGNGHDGRSEWVGHFDVIDIEQRSRAQADYFARHDHLTGLINRRGCHEALRQNLELSTLGTPFCLLSIDLDSFKPINDTLGHPTGDIILRHVAERLRNCVRATDIVARHGGDEFMILMPGVGDPEKAETLASRIVDAFQEPIPIDHHKLTVGVSIGIALCPRDGTRMSTLLRHSDLAMYRAKREGRNGYRLFDPTMDRAARVLQTMKVDLRDALAREELGIVYQPIVSAESGRVVAAEALLRWSHPTFGSVSPSDFIPIAETDGLMVPIGRWALEQACRTATTWPNGIAVAVNLSPVQFQNDEIVQTVEDALGRSGLAPGRLQLEVTESLPLMDDRRNFDTLLGLRSLGVATILDDFGSGYSSLAYLRRFRFGGLKLDRSLIEGTATSEGLAVVRAVLRLAADLNMTATAEGVSTREQFELALMEGCGNLQGYLLGRPAATGRFRRAALAAERRFAELRASLQPGDAPTR